MRVAGTLPRCCVSRWFPIKSNIDMVNSVRYSDFSEVASFLWPDTKLGFKIWHRQLCHLFTREGLAMALIEKISHKEQQFRHQDPVECTYDVLSDERGQKYLQLLTFGTKGRDNPGMVSQIFGLDRPHWPN